MVDGARWWDADSFSTSSEATPNLAEMQTAGAHHFGSDARYSLGGKKFEGDTE